MDGMQPDESGSSLVSITVLSVMPARADKLFALSPNSGNARDALLAAPEVA